MPAAMDSRGWLGACLAGACPGPQPVPGASTQVDDDPPVAFWDALEHKKWGLRKVGGACERN